MSFASPLIFVSAVLSLFFLLLPVALVVVLQVWLCKKSKKLGLILPILSLLLSLLMVLSVASLQRMGGGASLLVTDEEGNVVQEEVTEFESEPITLGDVGAVAGVFLVSNIPTVVFGGIWLYYKNRRDFKDDLKKMKIEDLE